MSEFGLWWRTKLFVFFTSLCPPDERNRLRKQLKDDLIKDSLKGWDENQMCRLKQALAYLDKHVKEN